MENREATGKVWGRGLATGVFTEVKHLQCCRLKCHTVYRASHTSYSTWQIHNTTLSECPVTLPPPEQVPGFCLQLLVQPGSLGRYITTGMMVTMGKLTFHQGDMFQVLFHFLSPKAFDERMYQELHICLIILSLKLVWPWYIERYIER